MKIKILVSLFLLPFSIFSFSQISSNGKKIVINKPSGLHSIFIFDKIDNGTEFNYTGTATTIRWFEFLNGKKNEISNQKYIFPENNKGYILEEDGKETAIWVFDYSKFQPNLHSFTAVDGDFPCSSVSLQLETDVPEFIYQNPQGAQLSVKRNFTVSYQTLTWKNSAWATTDTTLLITLPGKNFSVPAPLTQTTFTLSGDQFANELGVPPFSITSGTYEAKAVKCRITAITATRDALNENNRPNDSTQLDGSAPLTVQFFAHPTANAINFEWKIYKDGELTMTRREQNHTYNFEQSGNYKVNLLVSNAVCTDSAAVDVLVSESQLFVPKIFTPNGDGFNDEFRVAYQSIVEFEATVVNRWGRVLFRWNNPAKGWNGTANGKAVPEGTYFYIIKARGSDNKPYKLKGHINLLR